MAESRVQLERSGPVATLTFDDPPRRNAMTRAMGEALAARIRELSADEDLRVVILTGAGDAFSAGGDLDMIESQARAGVESPGGEVRERHRRFMREFYGLFLSVRDLPCPTVAAVNGHAIGAGFCVALACDLRIAARNARLGLNFARLGIHPGMGATWMLPRLVGPARAAELLYTGRIVDGAGAERLGLVNEAVARQEVGSRARALAEEIAGSAPGVVRATKRSLARSAQARLSDQLDTEAAEQALNYESQNLLEGLAAARERRTPRFTGNS
ncbi:MAG: enoyl-CoA hydratase/isomerase family protein [Myxococcota bacterium]